ncbi:DUF2271 domain-containing protein [Aquimarina sp. 2201CG5-10]|uniref:DUF2271 domain-containing protein n=1 Tax=Aquimarina callyspongiae TaxID=3098150 RepID=UPI002AB3BF0D|nr:DUF2271 domain-containing protein [Aquimarina sp. 2201CG5-10]MDY8138410.1 DUF2271 domain-containing protein [Aquimarina sp. 2201CG5-10]
MKTILKLFPLTVLTLFMLLAFNKPSETTNVKCMIQMVNYTGEGAYVVVSLINPKGEYEKTLYVQGKDKEWYSDITQWWKFYGKRRPDIDAISGATVGGGERTISIVKIPRDKIDAGYAIRFETAVEDQEYYVDDVQFELTSESVKSKVEGKGFIRYVRMMPQ